jgi:hypothetical protein
MPHAQRADLPEEKEGFSNKPVVLAYNGYGTKVKLWNNTGKNGEFQTISIERSDKDGDEWKTQKVSLNADDLLSVARGLEKGMTPSLRSRSASKARAAANRPQNQTARGYRGTGGLFVHPVSQPENGIGYGTASTK